MYLPIGHVSEANLRVDQPRVELLREAPPDHLRPVHQNQHAARQQAARAAQKTRASARGACAWCAPSSVSLVARGARAPHRARDETFTQTNRARARPDRPGLDLEAAAQPCFTSLVSIHQADHRRAACVDTGRSQEPPVSIRAKTRWKRRLADAGSSSACPPLPAQLRAGQHGALVGRGIGGAKSACVDTGKSQARRLCRYGRKHRRCLCRYR